MKKNIRLFSLLMLLCAAVNAQSFNAVVKGVYNETTPGVFQIDMLLKSGAIKTGDKVDIVTPEGKRYAFTVTRMRNPFEDIQKADANMGTFYMYVTGPKDAVFTKYSTLLPAGAKPSTTTTTSSFDFTSLLDDKAWNAISLSTNTFYKKGAMKMYGGRPFLMLSFRAAVAPDNRHLDIVLFTPDLKPGKYAQEKMELLFSGSATGDKQKEEIFGFKYQQAAQQNCVLEITTYKENQDGTATISGKLTGTLKKLLGTATKKFNNAVFTNIKIYIEK